ncbi:MAG: PAS domain-containing sensor histidine kinase, partial [Methanobacterium sp.]
MIKFQAPLDFDNIKNIGFYNPTKSGIAFIDYTISIIDSGFLVHIQDITEQRKAEDELIESEKRYHLVADFTYDWEEWCDTQEKLKYVSPSCERITGYSPKEFMDNQDLILDIIHPKDLELFKKHLNNHFSSFKAESIQFRIISRDKNIHWIEHICQPVYDDNGRFMGRRASNRDITERKKVEDELKSSQQMLENVLENFPGIVFWKDRNSVYLGCNKNFSSRAGLAKPSEIIGKSDYDQELPWKKEAELYRADDLQVIESEIPKLNIIETMRQIDGHVAWFDTNKVPLHDPDGNVIGVLGTSNDITERKKAEEALKESDKLMKMSQKIAQLGSWELDLINDHLYWSDEVYRIFGLQPQEFSATYEAFLESVHPDDRKAVDDSYSGSIREGRDTYEIEHRVVRKSTGEVRFVHEKCEHFRDESGQIIRSVGMVHDITDRRKMEEELRKSHDNLELKVQERTAELDVLIDELKRSNQELQQFAYVSSHDLQEPLRTIASFTQLLERRYKGQLDNDADEFMGYIVDAAKRMQTLINDLLQYSRVTTKGKEFRSVDVNEVLDTVFSNLKTSIDENNAEITVDNLPTVIADGSQLVQL